MCQKTLHCHQCLSANIVKKGLTGKFKTGKLRYRCKDCKRTFVSDGHSCFVPDSVKAYIDKSLLEHTSLRGICRIFGLSLALLMAYIKVKYAGVSDDLGFKFKPETIRCGDKAYIKLIDCQSDELYGLPVRSFVFRRKM